MLWYEEWRVCCQSAIGNREASRRELEADGGSRSTRVTICQRLYVRDQRTVSLRSERKFEALLTNPEWGGKHSKVII